MSFQPLGVTAQEPNQRLKGARQYAVRLFVIVAVNCYGSLARSWHFVTPRWKVTTEESRAQQRVVGRIRVGTEESWQI